tara:strand:- start:674 stop:1273 length:600 start_codon:yes stop_codon:yes gene_type:complete
VILLLSINPDNQRQETKTYDIDGLIVEAPRRFVPRRVQILPDQFQLMFDLTYPSDLVTLNYLEKRSPQILGDYPLEIILRRAKSADVIRSARISSIEMRKKMFKVSEEIPKTYGLIGIRKAGGGGLHEIYWQEPDYNPMLWCDLPENYEPECRLGVSDENFLYIVVMSRDLLPHWSIIRSDIMATVERMHVKNGPNSAP